MQVILASIKTFKASAKSSPDDVNIASRINRYLKQDPTLSSYFYHT
jgi:hypothetical protein